MVEATTARFHPGQIVHHRLYCYRGVVFDVDPSCLVEDEHEELPAERGQPWYHVLVDGSETVTYVAESSLEVDRNRDPVDHPLVSVVFGSYQGGRNYRGLDA